MSNKLSEVALPEPPVNAYLQSEIALYTKEDFFKNVWMLKYRRWTVSVRAEEVRSEEHLAYCFYNPAGEAKFSRIVVSDREGYAYNEMFKYFEWWVFSHESKLIEVELQPQEKAIPKARRLKGKRIAAKTLVGENVETEVLRG